MKFKSSIAVTLCLFLTVLSYSQTQVTGFGTNPGSLNMYKYVPAGITGAAPLVFALHGCTQTAAQYAQQSGWNKLADRHKFYLVYPEQISANNSSLCFNWFDTTDASRNKGEALSIKQMRDYMVANYNIDTTKIYVTGLSAGACMTVVMISSYPQVFRKGASMAGVPYRAATSSLTAYNAMNGLVTKTPAQWGALVRGQNPTFAGPFPHLAIFQGTSDLTVNVANATELIKQWTNLNHADQTADSTYNSFQGNANVQQTIYNDSLNNPVVYCYKITGMAHGIAVDTGSCPRKGGATATYAIEESKFHSTYWAADFFDLIKNPYAITGAIQVNQYATNVGYSVTNTSGSTYNWTVPKHAAIVSGQGTNSITVNFDTLSGNVEVVETTAAGCKNDAAELYVNVSLANGIAALVQDETKLFYCSEDNSLITFNLNMSELKNIVLYNCYGEKVPASCSVVGNKIFFADKLPAGLYIACLMGNKKQINCKMLVMPAR